MYTILASVSEYSVLTHMPVFPYVHEVEVQKKVRPRSWRAGALRVRVGVCDREERGWLEELVDGKEKGEEVGANKKRKGKGPAGDQRAGNRRRDRRSKKQHGEKRTLGRR